MPEAHHLEARRQSLILQASVDLGRRIVGLCCDALLAVTYPHGCVLCGASVEARADWPACAECWDAAPIFAVDDALCTKCGGKLQGQNVGWCRHCSAEEFTAARAVGLYDGALRAAVLELKSTPKLGARLAELLVAVARREPLCHATRVIPVPLHAERQRERGFNQAAVIARAIGKRLALPVDETSLVRPVHTAAHRSLMDAHARRTSVEKAFAVVAPRLVHRERILLVDDVLTTGATASAAARALLDAGAEVVHVLTIARAAFSAR